VALENDLLVLSDEIYEKILFDGHEHISIGSLPDMLDRTIVINGFSKAYAMTGWRLGYVAARGPLAEEILKVQQHSVTCASSFTQYAGIVALTSPQDAVFQRKGIWPELRWTCLTRSRRCQTTRFCT
jgi:aspartate aminotransferase